MKTKNGLIQLRSKNIDYALRRRNLKKLVSQLADNIGLREVIYGSKSTLLPRVIRKKKGLS